MALFDGLLGGGSADPYDLYGDILTAKQREALRARSSDQTWANAANFLAKAAMPTNKKIPLGGLLAGLAGAMGGSNQDEAVGTALKGAQTTAQIAKLRREQKFLDELSPYLSEAIKRQFGGAGGGVPPPTGAPAVPPPPAAAATMPPPMIVPPQPPVPAEGFPPGSGVPPGATTALPAATQMAGPLGGGAPGGGGGDDIWSLLASLQQGGGGGSGAPFDMASLGQGQGLPDVGRVNIELLSGKAAPAGRPTPDDRSDAAWEYYKPIIKKYESGGRNIEQGVVGPQGGYNPSTGTVTGPSSASGYLQMINPTWRAGAAKAGIDVSQYPRAINAPEDVQDEAGKALFKEQGLAPWAPYNRNLAQAVGWTGRSANSGLPDAGRVRIEPLGGEATPAGQAGLVPGLGVTPEALALMNAMAKLGGIDSPFGSLLDTYYKSPGYLGEKARTEAEANKGVALKFDPLIEEQTTRARLKVETELKPALEAAVEKAKNGPLQDREQAVADIARITKQLEQTGAAALNPTKVTVVGQDGQLITQDVTAWELAKRQQTRAERAARGDTRILPGDIVGAPTGNLPPGYQHRITPEGVITAGPVANTPAAREEAEAVEKKRLEVAQKQTATDFVVTDIDRIREKVKASPFTTTGVVGGWLSGINQTDAGFIKNAVEGIEANILLDRMLALKAASPTGASGLGSLTEQEGQRLVKAYGSLKNSQDTADFLYNLDRVQRLYLELVHGPVAAQQMMANRPEVAGPGAAKPAASPAASPALTQQMRTEAMQAIGKGAPRDKVLQRLREMGVDTGGL